MSPEQLKRQDRGENDNMERRELAGPVLGAVRLGGLSSLGQHRRETPHQRDARGEGLLAQTLQ